jgi:hypothetical protein
MYEDIYEKAKNISTDLNLYSNRGKELLNFINTELNKPIIVCANLYTDTEPEVEATLQEQNGPLLPLLPLYQRSEADRRQEQDKKGELKPSFGSCSSLPMAPMAPMGPMGEAKAAAPRVNTGDEELNTLKVNINHKICLNTKLLYNSIDKKPIDRKSVKESDAGIYIYSAEFTNYSSVRSVSSLYMLELSSRGAIPGLKGWYNEPPFIQLASKRESKELSSLTVSL